MIDQESDAGTDPATLVPGAHRVIRALDAAEGPFDGVLVTGDDAVMVCVEIDRLSDWPGWGFSGSEHVCGVVDVRRRGDGHDALLPWCTQEVETFLGKRLAAEEPLTAGERGTLVVSLLRGLAELGVESDAHGRWWLTDGGRPLFVHGSGGAARAATAALISRCGEHTTDRPARRLLEEIESALREPRHREQAQADWEDRLLLAAAPRALRTDVFPPERVVDAAPRRLRSDAVPAPRRNRRRRGAAAPQSRAGRRVRADAPTLPLRIGALRGSVRAAAGERLAALRRRPRAHDDREPMSSDAEQRPRRTRAYAVAAAAAAVVLGTGLLWPTGDGADGAVAASAERASEPVVAEPSPVDDASSLEDADAEPGSQDEAVDAVPALLRTIEECIAATDGVCADAIIEGALVPQEGLVAQGAGAATAELVDDYGDVAVVRLAPSDEADASTPEQMLVLERRNEKWLVRDAYDVAHQPEQN